MAYSPQEEKDKVVFVTKEDHESPSNAELVVDEPNDPHAEYGLELPVPWRNGQRPLWRTLQVCLFLLPPQHRRSQGVRLCK